MHRRLLVAAILCVLFAACGPSVEDDLDAIARGGEQAERAKASLLLSGDLRLESLLSAVESPRYSASRLELIEVLASLMLRSTDPRLVLALQGRLRSDPDPQVRARVIYQLSIRQRTELLGDFLLALQEHGGAGAPSGRLRVGSTAAQAEPSAGRNLAPAHAATNQG